MMLSNSIVIYIAVFFAIVIASDLVFRFILAARNRDSEINFRLELLRKSGDQLASYEELLRKRRLDKKQSFSFANNWVSSLYTQSGLTLTFARSSLYTAFAFFLSWVISRYLFSGFLLILLVSVILAVFLLILLVMRIRSRRILKFTLQLPDALDIIIRSLMAGHPIGRAIGLVAKEMPDPIGSEFGVLSDELTYGIPLDNALINMFHRVGADDIKLLAISMTVQKGTGGNLAEILENLSQVIRERTMIRAKIKAISAEGRITAFIMALFPFFLFFMIKTLVPDYFEPLWETGYGSLVVWVCSGFMVLGIIILYRLVKFDF